MDTLAGTLDEHAPGTRAKGRDIAFAVKSGENTALIHGSQGADYLLTVRHAPASGI